MDDQDEKAACESEDVWDMTDQQFAITARVNARRGRQYDHHTK